MGKGTLDNYLNNAKELSKVTSRVVWVLEDDQNNYYIAFDDGLPDNTNKLFLVAAYLGGKKRRLS